jgi:iron complex outermembrane recepter protein
VLLNGRRVASYGLADDGQKVFVDLNLIPLEAVDRVEILKDGASAIYGSDAIAGVVNVILRKEFNGTVAKVTAGQSGYGDGREARVALTSGFGSLDKDRYNIFFNIEASKRNEIWHRDRADRGAVGRADLRDLGFSAQENLGGTGAILGNNQAGSAINGNVRNPDGSLEYFNRGNLDPATGFTRAFAGAACSNFTSHPQGDPGGGCLIDAEQVYGQVRPSQQSLNLFGRGTLQLSPNHQAYAELNLYRTETDSSSTPSGVSGSASVPGLTVNNADVSLGADHPDNPYFGTRARLRYLAADVGPRTSHIDTRFARALGGVKGNVFDWDYDVAALYSESKTATTRGGYLRRNVAFALLDPSAANIQAAQAGSAAYAALPAGTVWRIGENAGLNSREMYAALSPDLFADSKTKTYQLDLRAARDFGQLPGGPLGVAVGLDLRHESVRLDPVTGTDTADVIGLGFSAYSGYRRLYAVFGELLAPLSKTLELSAALRADHYTTVGGSVTPKLAFKWTPSRQWALRGSFAEGFRAPSVAESGDGGLSAFTRARDPVRCDAGVASACSPATIAIVTAPNPALESETSRSYTLGMILEPRVNTNVSFDLWQISRKNEINQETADSVIAAGRVIRDPSTSTGPGDPGAIVTVLSSYVNSASTLARGLDVDARQRFDLGGYGKLTLNATWTHLFTLKRTEQDGSSVDFAGSHGNCDVTNCMGTPADRINLGADWELGPWRVATIVNHRASITSRAFKDAPDCETHFADGRDAPEGCKVKSFTTVDLNLRWQATKQLQLFGSVQNLFDAKPPLDVLTYGAVSYNPLDYSGAVGRFFNVGAKYSF